MALKIEMLRSFHTVARSGNLADAAAVLNRTPSAVSMTLKQFEAHLGEPLFETDRKSQLTALGQYVLEQAERELQHFDETVRAIENYASASLGHVRIAAVPSVAGTLLPRVISRNIDAYQTIHIELRDMDSRSVLLELEQGRIDIGIATLGHGTHSFHCKALMTDRFGVLCSADHPIAATRGSIGWDALRGQRFISNSLSELIDVEDAADLHAVSRISAQNLTSILGMVRANVGFTILPELAALSIMRSDVVFRPIADSAAKRHIHILRKSEKPMSPAARMIETDILTAAHAFLEDQNR